MPFLFQYLIKFSISLALLYLFYYIALRRLTFYQWNRFYLIGYCLLSFIVPFINITEWLTKKDIDNNNFVNSIPALEKLTAGSFHSSVNTTNNSYFTEGWNLWAALFVTGTVVMLLRIVYQYLSLRQIKKKAILLRAGSIEFYDVDSAIIPFSFANAIFINSRSHTEEEFKRILEHEFVHVKQKHTLDIIIAELVCAVNWFNPFAWLIRRSIRQNLEFIADKNVLQKGIDMRQYQYLLLKVIGLSQYSLTNNFNFSSLKKRIMMMNKIRSARVHLIKFLFVLPLLTVMLLAFRNRLKLNKDPHTVTYRGKVNVAKDQPLKNKVIDGLNANSQIMPGEKEYLKSTFSVVDSDTLPSPHHAPAPPAKLPVVDSTAASAIPSVPVMEAAPAVVPVAPVPPVEPPVPAAAPKKPNVKISPQEKQVSNKVVVTNKVAVNEDAVNVNIRSVKTAVEVSPVVSVKNVLVTDNDTAVKPLYIIDNKIQNEEGLKNIEPGQVSEVNVIKGPDAVALYGNKAANGVIQITTNAGHEVPDHPKKGPVVNLPSDFKGLIFINGKASSKAEMDAITPSSIESLTIWKDNATPGVNEDRSKDVEEMIKKLSGAKTDGNRDVKVDVETVRKVLANGMILITTKNGL